MANSASHALSTAEMNGAAPRPRFCLFSRPDFVAAVDGFREHFGQEVRSKIVEGYTFLGKDKAAAAAAAAAPAHRQAQRLAGPDPELPASKKAHSAHGASPARSSAPHGSPAQHPPAAHSRGPRPAPGPATTASGASASFREGESTLDILLSSMKRSPQATPGASRAAPHPDKGVAQGADFQKTVVVSQAQCRLDALDVALPTHLSITLPPMERLLALQAGIGRLKTLAEQRWQAKPKPDTAEGGRPAHENGRSRPAAVNGAKAVPADTTTTVSPRRHRLEDAGPRPKPEPEPEPATPAGANHSRKRSTSSFIFQLRVSKMARRQVIDAISATCPGKRSAAAATEAVHASPKRARKNGALPSDARSPGRLSPPPLSSPGGRYSPVPADSPPTSPRPTNGKHLHRGVSAASAGTTVASSGAAEPRSLPLQDTRQRGSRDANGKPAAAAAAANSVAFGMSEAEIEGFRQQSARLLSLMRLYKHGGDAAREKGGRVELEVGHYLESLACCLEDFWCRRVWQPPHEASKNWSTMLGICEYAYKRCTAKEHSPLRGCASLVAASVYYQLATASLEVAREVTGAGADADAATAVRDASGYLADMARHEQASRALLDAHNVARLLPQTWAHCQEAAVPLGDFELRSHPHTKRWPPVAYPVGATSSPLDIANFVRQLCHEFLDRSGLSLQAPKG